MKFQRRKRPTLPRLTTSKSCSVVIFILIVSACCILVIVFFFFQSSTRIDSNNSFYYLSEAAKKELLSLSSNGSGGTTTSRLEVFVPNELLKLSVYSVQDDFVNEVGKSPPYWNSTKKMRQKVQGASLISVVGPCFVPQLTDTEWRDNVEKVRRRRNLANDNDSEATSIHYHDRKQFAGRGVMANNNLTDLCRPGFLIIGAGKVRFESACVSVRQKWRW